MIEIISGLFLGDEDDARDFGAFRVNEIHAVVNCAPSVPNYYEKKGIDYLSLAIEESSEITGELATSVFQFLELHENNGNILIHCAGGNQRSPAIMQVALIRRGFKFFDAFELIDDLRPAGIPPTFTMIASIARLDLTGEMITTDQVRAYFFDTYKLLF